MICSSSGGVSFTISLRRFGSFPIIAAIVDMRLFPGNARCPEIISYSTEPKEKISERASTAFPSACSGDI